jgi:spore coat polysaccharide biosynthesis protein SpsF
MTSSRLPGKPMMEVCGHPILGHLVDRLKAVESIDVIVLATTTNHTDDVMADYASSIGIEVFRGDENDVMGRVVNAGKSVDADVIVEITGDCPIIDPEIIEQAIRVYRENTYDYVGNQHVRSYPDGMDVQVFALDTLVKSELMTNDPLDREHVTLHIRNNPQIFSHLNIVAPPEQHWPDLGLTLDEQSDFNLLKVIIENFHDNNPLFSCLDVVRFLRANQQLVDINSEVLRKGNT